MQHNNLFAEATRINLTVSTDKGEMNVIRLWQLSLDTLNLLAKNINKRLKSVEDEEDFLNGTSAPTQEQALDGARLEILKYIIKYKLTQNALKQDSKEKAAQKQVLVDALATLEASEIKLKSKEQLLAELEALG